MTAGTGYPTEYDFRIDASVFPVVLREVGGHDFRVPHSNVHSCVRSRGACTPFVRNTPGLATHTPAMAGNLTAVDGSYWLERFSTEVRLAPGSYTVIAHTRFFVPDAGQDPGQACYPGCLATVDAATGILRDVTEPAAATSTDAYVAAGAIAGCMLIGGASVAWAARAGRLQPQALLRAATRDEVVLAVDIVVGLGDIVAYTIGFSDEVLVGNGLKDIVPAAALFLATGWAASLFAAWQRARQLRVLLQQHCSPERYMDSQERAILRRTLRGAGPRGERCGRLSGSDEGRDLIRAEERARRRLRSLYVNLATLALADAPLTAVGIYVVLNGDGVDLPVVAALCGSTAMVGAKAAGLRGVVEQHQRVGRASSQVERFLDACPPSDGLGVEVQDCGLEKEASGAAHHDSAPCEAKAGSELISFRDLKTETV